jgi:hypothetical protein
MVWDIELILGANNQFILEIGILKILDILSTIGKNNQITRIYEPLGNSLPGGHFELLDTIF